MAVVAVAVVVVVVAAAAVVVNVNVDVDVSVGKTFFIAPIEHCLSLGHTITTPPVNIIFFAPNKCGVGGANFAPERRCNSNGTNFRTAAFQRHFNFILKRLLGANPAEYRQVA